MRSIRLLLGLSLLVAKLYADTTTQTPQPTVVSTPGTPPAAATTTVNSPTAPATQTGTGQTSAPTSQTSTAPEAPYLYVMLTRVENPAGTLQNGKACSKFAFAGSQCSLHLEFCVAETGSECNYNDYGVISTGSNYAQLQEASYNSIANPINVPLAAYFKGFNFKIRLTNQNKDVIDEWTGQYTNDNPKLQGIATFFSDGTRSDGTTTSVQLAWTSNAAAPTTPAPTTTPVATTVSTTILPSGSSVSPMSTLAPSYPIDCEDVIDRTNGVHNIYPDGKTAVPAYCVFSPNHLSGALTVIQSRDINKKSDEWKTVLDAYKSPFGNVEGNYWVGLNNMVLLSLNNTYDLRIDVCCKDTLIDSQIYNNFAISDENSGFKLNADSTVDNVGLAFKNTVAGAQETFSKTDIGAPFGTYESIKADDDLKSLVDSCDILEEVTDDGNVNFASTGGWWFGSCTNNLNAPFPQTYTDDSKCLAKIEEASPGVQLRSLTSAPLNSDVSFDGVSYTKVRMAIYRADKTLLQLPAADLCKG
ncbi:unnamed protein product [Auanema sp. JU1783]|nr:unnamed protein product [Auanema sp. JU1783]